MSGSLMENWPSDVKGDQRRAREARARKRKSKKPSRLNLSQLIEELEKIAGRYGDPSNQVCVKLGDQCKPGIGRVYVDRQGDVNIVLIDPEEK